MSGIDAENTRAVIQTLLNQKATKKGQEFEDLVARLFRAIPGLEMLKRRQRNVTNTAEIDLAFRVKPESPLAFFAPAVLVECKNQKTKVGSPAIEHFAKKLRSARLPGGVLVTLSGVSGSARSATGAVAALDRAREDGQVIAVLERSELEAVTNGEHLAAALQHKYLTMQIFGRHELLEPSDLRESGVKVLRGTDAIRRAIRDQRRAIVHEILERTDPLPPSSTSGADTIAACLQAVSLEVARAQAAPDEWWSGVRGALIGLGRSAVAQSAIIDPDFEHRETVRGNVSLHIPENLDVPVDGGLWRAMTTYLVQEAGDAASPRALDAALTLLGLTVDQIARIDDYMPEPEIWSVEPDQTR